MRGLSAGEWFAIAVVAVVAIYYLVPSDILGSLGDVTSPGSSGDAGVDTAGGAIAAIFNAISGGENVASTHNNPVGICGSYDANGNCLGPATYDSLEDGIAAGEALIQKYLVTNPSITVAQFIQKWTGGATAGYISKVETALGLNPGDPIAAAGGAASGSGDGTDGLDSTGSDFIDDDSGDD